MIVNMTLWFPFRATPLYAKLHRIRSKYFLSRSLVLNNNDTSFNKPHKKKPRIGIKKYFTRVLLLLIAKGCAQSTHIRTYVYENGENFLIRFSFIA